MFKSGDILSLLFDLLRTFLIEVLSDRVRRVRIRAKLTGMENVRRYVHRETRRRLLNRLSTEAKR
jgi:hypothetical protein